MRSHGVTRRHTARNAILTCVGLAVLAGGVVVAYNDGNAPGNAAASPSSRPVASSTTAPARRSPAADVIARQMKLRNVAVYTASNDPNHMLGRQGEYTSKINWGPSRASSIEVFGTAADARARGQYVSGFRCPFGDGYDYVSGTALIRIGCDMSPVRAHKLLARFHAIVTG